MEALRPPILIPSHPAGLVTPQSPWLHDKMELGGKDRPASEHGLGKEEKRKSRGLGDLYASPWGGQGGEDS